MSNTITQTAVNPQAYLPRKASPEEAAKIKGQMARWKEMKQQQDYVFELLTSMASTRSAFGDFLGQQSGNSASEEFTGLNWF